MSCFIATLAANTIKCDHWRGPTGRRLNNYANVKCIVIPEYPILEAYFLKIRKRPGG